MVFPNKGTNSSCQTAEAASGTSCNNDSDGCTVDDACDGDGACVAGAAASCTPSDVCHTVSCTSTGDNSYTCDESNILGCCLVQADCLGQGKMLFCRMSGYEKDRACQNRYENTPASKKSV